MKLRKMLMISLVMALGVVITGSIASARPAADLTEHLEWYFTLECDDEGGGPGLSAKVVFRWTQDGEEIGNKVVLRCTEAGSQTKYRFVPDEANDWHVKILVQDAESGEWVKCYAQQSWTGAPPLFFAQECLLPNGMETEFTHYWTGLF